MKRTKEELKQFFENGDKPTQEQFWDWQDSYWHKNEEIPIVSIKDLSDHVSIHGTTEGKEIDGILYFKSELPDVTMEVGSDLYITHHTYVRNSSSGIGGYSATSTSGQEIGAWGSDNGDDQVFLNVFLNGALLADRKNLKGLKGEAYYGDNYEDLHYTQKKYVDKANSYSTEEIKTGGIWIDGKPLYRKVLTFTPSDLTINGDFVIPNYSNISITSVLEYKTLCNGYTGIGQTISIPDLFHKCIYYSEGIIGYFDTITGEPVNLSNISGFSSLQIILEYTKNGITEQ